MSLVATEPVRPPSDPAPDDGGAKIESLPFWPVILLADLRRAMRLDGQVTTDRLMSRTIEAVAHVNGQLFLWRQVQVDAGYLTLAEIPADPVNGESVKIWRYKNAVWSLTKALLIEGYRDVDTTSKGEDHAEALSTQIDTLWRDVRWSIRDILDESRGLAELV
ncbi:MAG: head completion/stabilization protein [Leclercia sp.]